MVTPEEINFINSEYSQKGGGSDPTEILGSNRLSWVSNSGSRQQMFTGQIKQAVMIDNPDVAKLTTGHEKFFGKYADSFKKADTDYRIVARINRYTSNPTLKYVLVIQDIRTGIFDVVNVKHFENMTDCHGYIRETLPVDYMGPGQIIPKGEYFYKATTLDEDGNYRYGKNCNVAYMTLMPTIEDSIICSRSFAENTTFTLIEKLEFSYDTNHVMLNLYGDNNSYKCLPEINEQTFESGILCSIRSINKKNIASDLTADALRNPKGSDLTIKGRGKLIDISIHTNDPEKLDVDEHRSQIRRLYLDEYRYHKEIVDILSRIVSNKSNHVTDMLKYTLSVSRNYVDPNVKFSSDTGEFEFCYITAYVAYKTGLNVGFKLTNRHGGKGVIGAIFEDDEMPVDVDGVRADLIVASAGVIPRMNVEQKYEHELNFIADKFVRHHLLKEPSHENRIKMLIEFCSDIDPEYATELAKVLKRMNKYEQQKFIREIEEEGLYLQIPPFNKFMTLDSLANLYRKYNIEPGFVRMRVNYKDEPDGENYVSKEYADKLKDLAENYFFVQNPKNKKQGLKLSDYQSQKKNPLNLSKKQYEQNKWIDEFVWEEKGVKLTDNPDEYNTNKSNMVTIVDNPNDILDYNEFNDPRTRIYKNSDGSVTREYRSPHPIIIASVYYMVLKHIPDAKKFSARNLGPVSSLGLPCKSNRSTVGIPFPDTSNRCGEMETECLNRRIPNEATARWMATHATNPEYVIESARQQLLDDPLELHDVPIEDGIPKDTIPARTFRAYLGAIGINVLDTGEEDPFEWFDTAPFEDVDDMMRQIKRKQNKENKSL